VDIGCAFIDRIEQYFVDEADYGCVIHLNVGDIILPFISCCRDLQILEIHIGELAQGVIEALDVFFDGLCEFVLFYQDGFSMRTGVEFDVIQRLQIRGIRHGQKQAVAALEQGQYVMPADQLFIHEFGGRQTHVYGIEIRERDAKLIRQRQCQLTCIDQFVLNQISD